jgi:hypothetical protein
MTATALAAVGSNANESGTLIISGTAVSASGTSVDFTGIPPWAKRITVMFNGVSTNGSSNILVQIGAGSVTTSGYNGGTTFVVSASYSANSSGFLVANSVGASAVYSGTAQINSIGSNGWVYTSNIAAATNVFVGGGAVTLGGTLDRVRITTVNGTDTFDAGTVNIMWE